MSLIDELSGYRARGDAEAADVACVAEVVRTAGNPYARTLPLHVTASALVLHPESGRVLLRWHARQRAWLQIGGHGDPGETEPLEIVLREGREETGLTDLVPAGGLLHVAVVPVPAKGAEPAHEHGDLRYVLTTSSPEAIRPERADAPLRWLTFADAMELTTEPNVRETLTRAAAR
ncbi:NUDIX hydrolase [Amycolatopsis sp.]|uniref:NUDIX hydrolase n=1 Tax=Amycolatopsis sp. TaxID=37632 RepID=UPI002CE672E2|nr:NUDIX domain-containing protein [Amycolatopsis sp.]HVV14062.1 NUDIX domain-containing protein [Amycolatopsis sp.]